MDCLLGPLLCHRGFIALQAARVARHYWRGGSADKAALATLLYSETRSS